MRMMTVMDVLLVPNQPQTTGYIVPRTCIMSGLRTQLMKAGFSTKGKDIVQFTITDDHALNAGISTESCKVVPTLAWEPPTTLLRVAPTTGSER